MGLLLLAVFVFFLLTKPVASPEACSADNGVGGRLSLSGQEGFPHQKAPDDMPNVLPTGHKMSGPRPELIYTQGGLNEYVRMPDDREVSPIRCAWYTHRSHIHHSLPPFRATSSTTAAPTRDAPRGCSSTRRR